MTRHQAVTTTPTALTGVQAGTQYSVQNKSNRDVYISVQTTAPDADELASWIIEPKQYGYPKANTGESIFVWVQQRVIGGRNGLVAYEEST